MPTDTASLFCRNCFDSRYLFSNVLKCLFSLAKAKILQLSISRLVSQGDKGSAVVTIQNAGNIAMGIDVTVRCLDDQGRKLDPANVSDRELALKVWPARILVPPHQKTKDIIVKFTPDKEYHKSAPCRGIVLLKVTPFKLPFQDLICILQ